MVGLVFLNNGLGVLSYLAAGFHAAERRCHGERVVEVDGRENHSLTLHAHHLARGEVGHEQYVLAHELLGFIEGGNATENGAVGAAAIVDGELQELLALLHTLAVFDVTYTYVELLKVLKRHLGLYGLCLVGSGLIGLAGSLELVELVLDGVVFYLLEEQFGLGQLVTGDRKSTRLNSSHANISYAVFC